jgi:hypothetical protein
MIQSIANVLRMAAASAALVLLPWGHAAAQSLEDVVWAAVTLERTLETREVTGLLALGALHRLAGGEDRRADPERVEAASRWLNDAMTRLEQGGPRCSVGGDAVDGMRCALQSLLPGAPADVAQALAAEGRAFVAQQARTQLSAQAQTSLTDPFQRYAETVLDQVVGLRAQLTSLQGENGAWDPYLVLQRFSGVDARAGIPSLLAGSTGLQGLADGVLGEGRDVMAAYHAYLTSLTGSARGWLSEAQTIDGRVQGLRSQASDRAMVYLTRQTAALAGFEASVTDRIRVFGNAALDLQGEGTAFFQNLRVMGQQAAVGLLSGNMLTVAQGVAAFLQVSPAAFGGAAAADLRELREMVTALEAEVREGFGGVDARLDEVFRELDRGFGQMERLVQSQHREVMTELGEIRAGLETLAARTDQLESNLRAYLEAGFDRDHSRTLIRCLEHRDRFAIPMAEPVFRECLTDFRARGSQDARDALLTDRTTPVHDASLIRALASRSPDQLARSLPLIARAAEQRYRYTALGGGRGGANPLEWAIAAQAYATMLEDWPTLAESVGPADLEALLAVGIELQGILRALVTDPASGEVGHFSRLLLEGYTRGLDDAVAEADLLARRYQQAQLRRVDPNLLLNQAAPAGGSFPALSLPDHVRAGIPTEVRTATVLALEAPVLLYHMTTTDSVSLERERRRWTVFGRDHDRRTYTYTTLTLELRQSGGGLVSTWSVTGPPVLRQTEVMAGRLGSTRTRSARTHIPDPQQHFLAEIFPQLAASEDGWRQGAPSRAALTALGQAIEAELRRFESASLNRVFGAVCDVGQAAMALGPEDQASVVRLRRALDEMTVARRMLTASAGLALPDDRWASEPLASLLDGPDALLDRDRLCGIVASGESPLRVVWLEEEPGLRLRALSASLEEAWADQAWTDPAGILPARTSTRIDETVNLLRRAILVQEVRRLTASVP